MNEYLKRYIELKKQFVATNNSPDSVRSLYAFKEELEYMEEEQAKEVLVDVYDLLDFKKDAYDLLCQIGNRSDKKTLKRLGTLKDYAENWGNHYAIPKPKTPKEKQSEKEQRLQLGLPTFRYHPDPLDTESRHKKTSAYIRSVPPCRYSPTPAAGYACRDARTGYSSGSVLRHRRAFRPV